jgi:hypothetical protein
LGEKHHNYLDNFYDSVKVAETLLDRKWEFVALWGLTEAFHETQNGKPARSKRSSQRSGGRVTSWSKRGSRRDLCHDKHDTLRNSREHRKERKTEKQTCE